MSRASTADNAVTRRTFLAAAGLSVCSSFDARGLLRPVCGTPTSTRESRVPALLHAAVLGGCGHASIQSFALDHGACTLAATTPSAGFTALAVHPLLPLVYGAADTSASHGLPGGQIDTFHVDTRSGRLRPINSVPMSLSATGPRALAVSPDGAYLLVSAWAGGIWNAFRLDAHGLPGETAVARKALGAGTTHPDQAAAHPHSVLFPANSSVAITTDSGANQLALLRPGDERIAVLAQCDAGPGAGPSACALSADHTQLLVANCLASSISLWRISVSGPTLHHLGTLPTPTPVTGMVADPESSVVWTLRAVRSGSCLESWDLARAAFLAPAHSVTLPWVAAASPVHHDNRLWAATAHGLVSIAVTRDGRAGRTYLHAALPGVRALSLQFAGTS